MPTLVYAQLICAEIFHKVFTKFPRGGKISQAMCDLESFNSWNQDCMLDFSCSNSISNYWGVHPPSSLEFFILCGCSRNDAVQVSSITRANTEAMLSMSIALHFQNIPVSQGYVPGLTCLHLLTHLFMYLIIPPAP